MKTNNDKKKKQKHTHSQPKSADVGSGGKCASVSVTRFERDMIKEVAYKRRRSVTQQLKCWIYRAHNKEFHPELLE